MLIMAPIPGEVHMELSGELEILEITFGVGEMTDEWMGSVSAKGTDCE